MSGDTEGRILSVATAIGTRLDGRPLAIMLDVDGTLAPIAPRPQDAAVPTETRAIVARLAAIPAVHVALVSGRAAADAYGMVDVAGVWVLGNHGMELRTPQGAVQTDPAVQRFEEDIASAARELASRTRALAGVIVENKRWSLSVHYRLADEPLTEEVVRLVRDVALTRGLRVTDGKKVVELRPPVSVDKGTATIMLAERLGALDHGAALFAGDDRTDEDAFRALRRRKSSVVTIRIGHDVQETDAEFGLESADEFRQLLGLIADRLSPPSDA